MISFKCSACGKAFRVKDELAGKKTKCPQCATAITVPMPEEPVEEAMDLSLVPLPSSPASPTKSIATKPSASMGGNKESPGLLKRLPLAAMIGGAAVLLVLIVGVFGLALGWFGGGDETIAQPAATSTNAAANVTDPPSVNMASPSRGAAPSGNALAAASPAPSGPLQLTKLHTFGSADEPLFTGIVSPDGRYVLGHAASSAAASSEPGAAILFDVASGKERRRWPGARLGQPFLAFHPQGKHVIISAQDSEKAETVVYDMQSGQAVQRVPTYLLAISPDGRTGLARDQLWDLAQAQPVRKLVSDAIIDNESNAAFSHNGQRVVIGSLVYDVATGQQLVGLPGFNTCGAVSPDGRRAVAGNHLTVALFDLETGQQLKALEGKAPQPPTPVSSQTQQLLASFAGPLARLMSVEFSPDGRYLVTNEPGQNDLYLRTRLWDVNTGEQLHVLGDGELTLAFGGIAIRKCPFTPDSRYVFTDNVQAWETATGQMATTPQPGRPLDISSDGRYVLALTGPSIAAGSLTLYELPEALLAAAPDATADATRQPAGSTAQTPDGSPLRLVRTFDGHRGGAVSLAFSTDGGEIVSAACESLDRTLRRWNRETASEIAKFEIEPSLANTVAISPDGKYVVAGGQGVTSVKVPIGVTDIATGKPVHIIRPGGNITCFSADGRRFATREGQVFDVATGQAVARIQARGWESDALSPDGSLLVVGSNGFADLWDLSQQKIRHTLMGHQGLVALAAFSPNGGRVLTGTSSRTVDPADKFVRMWDVESGSELKKFPHLENLVAAAFASGGRRVLTMDGGKKLHVWDAESGQLLQTVSPQEAERDNWMRMQVSPDQKHVLVAGAGELNRIWLWALAN
jgi:WD40 repeat protein